MEKAFRFFKCFVSFLFFLFGEIFEKILAFFVFVLVPPFAVVMCENKKVKRWVAIIIAVFTILIVTIWNYLIKYFYLIKMSPNLVTSICVVLGILLWSVVSKLTDIIHERYR